VTAEAKVEETKNTDADLRQEFEQFMGEMKRLTSDNNKFTQDYQLDRLLNQEFINPYDILELGQEANDTEIKKRFRMLSILIHPDKCKHERAPDAFHVLEQAYKTLIDPDKRRMY
jgi:DnaJ family protein C protein 8